MALKNTFQWPKKMHRRLGTRKEPNSLYISGVIWNLDWFCGGRLEVLKHFCNFTKVLRVTSSESRSVCVKHNLNTHRWLVNALVTWHVSYKITTLKYPTVEGFHGQNVLGVKIGDVKTQIELWFALINIAHFMSSHTVQWGISRTSFLYTSISSI